MVIFYFQKIGLLLHKNAQNLNDNYMHFIVLMREVVGLVQLTSKCSVFTVHPGTQNYIYFNSKIILKRR